MRTKSAFTILEIIVTISIMALLLTLGVANFANNRAVANDETRKADVANFSIALEDYYRYGNAGSTSLRYPSTDQLAGGTSANISATLPDLDQNNLIAPGSSSTASTLTMATNNVATTAGVLPQPTTIQYVYQPLAQDGTLCTVSSVSCSKYYIYYRLETDNTVYQYASRNK